MTPARETTPPHRWRVDLAWVTTLAVFIIGLLLALQVEARHRHETLRHAAAQADVLAASVSAALAFDDQTTLREYIGSLAADPQVAAAAIYDATGAEVAHYGSGVPPRLKIPANDPVVYAGRMATVVAPVRQKAARLGAVYLRTVKEPLSTVVARHSALALMMLTASLLLLGVTLASRQLERRARALAEMNVRLQHEIDERARVEDALRQSQKMEALGQLTGGVAHDFNNLLTVIVGGLETIGRVVGKMPLDAEHARLLRAKDMALNGAERAATLTQRLLAFSRRQPLQPRPLSPNQMIQGMAELLRRTLGETVAFETVLAAGAWSTRVDPSQLESALLNLAVNARDAMPDGGRLTIETSNASLDEPYVASLAEALSPGQYVMIAVSDTGAGMPPEILRQVFEPFFTTKDVGKGTGLGLSQVYGFVRQSGGHVAIYSEVDQGTSVKIYLPRNLAEGEVATDARTVDTAVLIGDETILVVEDHEDLRGYSVGILQELGYRVLSAGESREALAVLRGGQPIDLLFTDVVLPGGMNGRNLADAALALRPNLRVLFTTGYTRNAIVHNGTLDPGVDLIQKPFTFEQLAQKIRQVLDAAPRSASKASIVTGGPAPPTDT